MELTFRTLKANEIDCRIATINQNGLSLLLYKDARVDQNILDETVGALNWQRQHTRDNANCIVSIWDKDKEQWISKEDTGTESFTEKEKGLASDSFKRACFNWGIGRELYSAPFIWVSADKAAIKQGNNGKFQCFDKFIVDHIAYSKDNNIIELSIVNTKTGSRVYTMNGSNTTSNNTTSNNSTEKETVVDDETVDRIYELIADTNSDLLKLSNYFKINHIKELTVSQGKKCIQMLESKLK